jgi:RHS repeat-associated protein
MISATTKKPGPVTEYTETYNYLANNNLEYAIRGGIRTDYEYDYIDQLTKEAKTGWSQEYTYDANGNRLTKKTTVSGSPTTESYTYNAGDLLATAGAKSFTYDGCGRTKTVSVSGTLQRTYHWDYQDRLITTQYPDGGGTYDTNSYNGLNARMAKTVNGTSTTYKRNGTSPTAPVLSEGGRNHTPGVSYRESGATKYAVGDRLGTNSNEYDSSKANTSAKTFDAFGLQMSTSGSSNSPLKFAGKWGYQSDDSSGLQLLGNRFYDPSVGRFLTRDPIQSGRNWFAYAENNPLKWADPDGLDEYGGQVTSEVKPGTGSLIEVWVGWWDDSDGKLHWRPLKPGEKTPAKEDIDYVAVVIGGWLPGITKFPSNGTAVVHKDGTVTITYPAIDELTGDAPVWIGAGGKDPGGASWADLTKFLPPAHKKPPAKKPGKPATKRGGMRSNNSIQ